MSDKVDGTAIPAALRARKASAGDLPAVTDTLALSFYDDPVLMWIIDDGKRRRELLPGFFGAVAHSYLAYDELYAVDEGVTAAVWAPPGAEDDEELPPVLGEAVEEYAERLFEVLGLLEEKHPVEPHYYLFLLGTRPQWQGRGLGSSLMAPVLENCDRDSVPAYLEATSERNKQLYLRHGFEVTDEIRPPDGPTMWRMWRSPT
ncbi:MAG: GNAT family N-acetyltransferase [Actinomycetota bacterium]|nr:GNAT family N-acetyltransferase [Actinomycetota bacterium]